MDRGEDELDQRMYVLSPARASATGSDRGSSDEQSCPGVRLDLEAELV